MRSCSRFSFWPHTPLSLSVKTSLTTEPPGSVPESSITTASLGRSLAEAGARAQASAELRAEALDPRLPRSSRLLANDAPT